MSKPQDEISTALLAPFPLTEIEDKNGQVYIAHEVIRKRLIDATGNAFDWSIDQITFRETSGEVRRAVNRDTGEVVRPDVMILTGTLTISGLGARAGIGVHPLDAGAGEDAAFKSADSDAFKRAAMGFGVGLQQLYRDATQTKRDVAQAARTPRSRTQQQPATEPTPTRQQAAEMTEKAFEDAVSRAMVARDGGAFRALIDQAGTKVSRWIAMIRNTDTVNALDWIERQMDTRSIDRGVALQREIESRRVALTAELSGPASLLPADTVQAGREAADRALR